MIVAVYLLAISNHETVIYILVIRSCNRDRLHNPGAVKFLNIVRKQKC